MNHYEILAKASGGRYTAEEVRNLEIYGVANARDMEVESTDECMCGKNIDKCPDAYTHMSQGY